MSCAVCVDDLMGGCPCEPPPTEEELTELRMLEDARVARLVSHAIDAYERNLRQLFGDAEYERLIAEDVPVMPIESAPGAARCDACDCQLASRGTQSGAPILCSMCVADSHGRLTSNPQPETQGVSRVSPDPWELPYE